MSPLALAVLLIAIFSDLGRANEPKVIVIGAGAAGLAAAMKLHKNGIDVTVLEAEPRIGGRIRTMDFGDGLVDMGAKFVWGEKGNVIYDMVKDMDLLKSTDLTINILPSNKMKMDENLMKEVKSMFNDILETWDNTVEDMPSGDRFMKLYKEAIMKKYPDDEPKRKEAMSLMNMFRHLIMAYDGTNEWNDGASASSYKTCEGEEALNWKKRGFKTFLDILMNKMDKSEGPMDSKILTGKMVEKIMWDKDMVTVMLKGGEEMKADYLIFTPSLGVLKEMHMDMFEPDLPEMKMKAIDTLGFGTMTMVAMHFPEIWWPKENFPGYTLLWVDEDEDKIDEEFTMGPIEDGKSWLTDLFGVFPTESNPHVLEMWFSGKMASKIEKMDDQTLIDGIDFAMKKFLDPSMNIMKADKIMKSDWSQNPHFRGCFSYETLESRKLKDPSDFERMMTPLMKGEKPMVMFAGEATHPNYYSTVHGAVETGWREAKRVMEHIHHMKNKVPTK